MENNSVDVFLISETKIDPSFTTAQFYIQGYSIPCRLNRTFYGDGILFCIREDISSILMQRGIRAERILIELNLKGKMTFMLLLQPKQKLNIQSSKRNRKRFWETPIKLWQFYPSRWLEHWANWTCH